MASVFTSNPAARRMMGLEQLEGDWSGQMRLTDVGALAPVAQAFANWLRAPSGFETAYVSVKPYDDDGAAWRGRRNAAAHLKLRFARVEALDEDEPERQSDSARCVIFMQDVSEIENQAQQLKLAVDGPPDRQHRPRSAQSAVGHRPCHRLAGRGGAGQADASATVKDRRRQRGAPEPHDRGYPEAVAQGAASWPADAAGRRSWTSSQAEFKRRTRWARRDCARIEPTDAASPFRSAAFARSGDQPAVNAVRYASGRPGRIRLFASCRTSPAGWSCTCKTMAPISPEVRAHLFEPFYTTSSKGTGLGLYLARELCLNNGACSIMNTGIDVQATDGQRTCSGRFVIAFAPRDPLSSADR